MKKQMFISWKSLSRSVHDEHQEQHPELIEGVGNSCTSLTVWRKSLIVTCKGFTVIDSNGNLVYRVDTYIGSGRPTPELVLMDGTGKPLSTMRRCKNLRLVDTWLVYGGEVGEFCTLEKPVFYVKKNINILQYGNVLAYVYRRSSSDSRRCAYTIEGSYSRRSCKVIDETKRVVAEIRPKDGLNRGICFGLEVFVLVVHAGIDPGFAMGLVLLLDQMFS